MAISSLSGVLPEPQHAAYLQAFGMVEQAEKLAVAGHPQQARALYRGLLKEVLLPEAGPLAAQRLKTLSKVP